MVVEIPLRKTSNQSEMGKRFHLRPWTLAIASIIALLAMTVASNAQPAAHSATLPRYELKMDAKELAAFERDPYSKATRQATFVADGERYEAKVRYRGEWARSWPKRPLKIFFAVEHLFHNQECINLNSGWRDPAFVRELLAYEMFAACGVPSPKARMVRLDVNGKFYGLYVEVEQPEKAFLRWQGLKGAELFKAISDSNQADERDLQTEKSFKLHYGKETQKDEGFHHLQSFCHELAQTTNVADFFNRNVDLDEYVNYLAASALVQHWDCFNKNHFLVFDGRRSGKWSVVPWDLDRTFGDHWRGGFNHAQLPIMLGTRELPGVTGWNRLQDRFFSEPALRARFLKRLEQLLNQEFTEAKLFPLLDRLESQIAEAAAMDRRRWPAPAPDLHTGIAEVKDYIKRRRAFVRREIALHNRQ